MEQKFTDLGPWKRAVIKVGSTLMTAGTEKISTKYILTIASFINKCRQMGREIVLVSSGAVAAGTSTQPHLAGKHQRTIPERQALAAIGQPLLMEQWAKFFDFPCAQMLLTYDGIADRKRLMNARNTLTELLKLRVLPIINENDTTAVDELKVGDNDNLAAYAAVMSEADLLIICSDIDGLCTRDPRVGEKLSFIPEIKEITAEIYALAGGAGSKVGTGGMFTKVQAAEKATSAGITTVILNGTRFECFENLLRDRVVGTVFRRKMEKISAKRHWMLHVLRSCGSISVDRGAVQVLRDQGASLLPSGITEIAGLFSSGDAVDIKDPDGTRIARGLVRYSHKELASIVGLNSHQVKDILPGKTRGIVVHRDEMVLV